MRRQINEEGVVAASLTQMPQSGNYSLYFHIPFCTKKCDYCHFYVIPDQTRFKEIYRRSLKQEWELRQSMLPPYSPYSIYFGGGTPALLGPKALEEILSWINPSPSCEITLEANPENVSLELMRAFHACGINRVSLGVQTLDDSLLKLISRTHTTERSLLAIEEIAQSGIENISIDLMYDLPNQTLQSWQQTLSQAVKLPITHLSLYNLTIEPHTVFFKKKKSLQLPNSETSFAMLQEAVELLENCGLHRYEISAFARNNRVSRHNIGYWTMRPFLGFGPSAFSYWQESRFRNVAHLNRYAKLLANNEDPIDFREKLTLKERLKESLAISLRLIDGIPHKKWPLEIKDGIIELKKEGFVENKLNRLRLTEKGLLFHDTVAEQIMSW